MMWYRAGPPVLEGIQVPATTDPRDDDLWREVWLMLDGAGSRATDMGVDFNGEHAAPGDWLVREDFGTVGPMDPETLETTYAPLQEEMIP